MKKKIAYIVKLDRQHLGHYYFVHYPDKPWERNYPLSDICSISYSGSMV